MKSIYPILMLTLILSSKIISAADEPLQYIGYSSQTRANYHETPPHNLSKHHIREFPKDHVLLPHSEDSKIANAHLMRDKPNDNPLLQLTHHYHKQGLPYFEAFLRAQQELQQAKDLPLEKELRSLGCIHWGEIKEISPSILETVKAFYKPEKGPFILKPGLMIVYLNEG